MAITHSVKFTASAKDAISEIQKYEDRIVATASTVDKHAASLGGSKILAQANNWTAAVQKIGGATALTGDEQRKVNAILDAAIQKYQALGQQAPSAMRELYEATKRVPEQTTQVQSGLSGILAKLGPLGPAMVGAFSVGAITSFVGSILDAADAIQKAADRTGDTAGRVQELQHIAGQTGTSFDGLINAAQTLQQRLGDGDDGATGALRKLGLSAAEIGRMGATEALYAINAAMQDVHTQTERAALMSDLFGKSWKDLAPAMSSDMRSIADDAPKMADSTVAALDRAGDRWNWLTGMVKVAAAETLNYSFEAARLATAADFWQRAELPVRRHEAAVRAAAGAMLDASTRAAKPLSLSLEDVDRISRELAITATTRTTPAVRGTADAVVEMFRATAFAAPQFTIINGQLVQTAKSAGDATQKLREFTGWAVDPLQASALNLGTTALPGVVDGMSRTGKAAVDAGDKIASAFGDAIRNLPSTLAAAFEGGGGVAGAIRSLGVQIGNALAGSLLDTLATRMQTGLASAFKGLSAWATGAAAGVIGIIAAGWSSMNRSAAEHERIMAENASLYAATFAQYEADLQRVTAEYDELYAQITRVEVARVSELHEMEAQLPILREIVETQTAIGDKEKELADLQASLVPSWDDVDAAVKRYGLSIDGAGQKVQSMKVKSDATKLINDWEMLTRAGWDIAGLAGGMKEELSAMVGEARRYGVELPSNMKPILESMIKQGELTDGNGEKLKDLSGIKFGDPVKSDADKIKDAMGAVTEKLGELIDKLALLVEESAGDAEKVAKHWEREPWADWRKPDWPSIPGETGGEGERERLPRFATGVQNFRGGWAVVGERGPELVRLPRGADVVPNVGSGGGNLTVPVVIDGREIARVAIRYQGRVLAVQGA